LKPSSIQRRITRVQLNVELKRGFSAVSGSVSRDGDKLARSDFPLRGGKKDAEGREEGEGQKERPDQRDHVKMRLRGNNWGKEEISTPSKKDWR